MPDDPRSIRVRVLDKEYPLRVAPADEAYTQRVASFVDERMRRIQRGIPAQPDLTHAIIGALQLAEELFAARSELDRLRARADAEADELADQIDEALGMAPPAG
jgi:cell division protein ZapA